MTGRFRLLAALCIAALLLAALMAPSDALSLPDLLAPLWLVLFTVIGFICQDLSQTPKRPRPFLPILAPRPPPSA
jgi:hypothetical protein